MPVTEQDLKKVTLERRGEVEHPEKLTVFTDTRQPVSHGLFVPLSGENFDAHEFIMDAIEAGAEAAFWERGRPVPENMPEGFPLYIVDDPLKALQTLATVYRERVNPIVIGVTGSNGKTTVKDMLGRIVNEGFRAHVTKGNLNNHIGLPLTILSMPENCEALVAEMGMNNAGEISTLSHIAKPDYAVITNIGESHIENLGSREGIASAKLEILDGMEKGYLYIDGDEPLLKGAEKTAISVVTCGYDDGNDYHITSVKPSMTGFNFTLNGNTDFELPLLGEHNVKNASLSIALGLQIGLSHEQLQAALNDLKLTEMRLQAMRAAQGGIVINDAYNASPTSMIAAIKTLSGLPGYSKKVAVLGDMYELGPDEKTLHSKVGEQIRPPVTDVITIGLKAKWIAEGLQKAGQPAVQLRHFDTKEAALPVLSRLLSQDTIILLKASRLARLETLAEELIK